MQYLVEEFAVKFVDLHDIFLDLFGIVAFDLTCFQSKWAIAIKEYLEVTIPTLFW